jgi:alpha-D-xyloside xylohydrolase
MKFTNGYWMMRDGVHPIYPEQVYEAEDQDGKLVVHAPAKQLKTRGDQLNLASFTVEYSSPLADCIRVKMTHFAGAREKGPNFETADKPAKADIIITDKVASFASGKLSAELEMNGAWGVSFKADGKQVTASQRHGLAYIETEEGKILCREELCIGVGETVYGLGERFTPFIKNGQSVDVWNEDGGTGSEQTYKNIPFYLTNRGYGVLVENPGLVSYEVATEKVSRVQFCVKGQSIQYVIIYGPSPKEILSKYTALTGRPALPPAWSFGLWLTTSFTTNYDEATCTEVVKGMEERSLPLHVFHFDCFWMKGFHWCDLQWDPKFFPDPRGMLKRLKARGLHICVWINPYIAQRSPLFVEGAKNGYLLMKPDGDVWQTDAWQAGMGIVDFTNPAATAWFQKKLEALLDDGVDCFKTDFGERIPTEVVYHDGSDPERMHNYYTYLYNKAVFDLLEKKRGKGEAVLFARSATVGGQKFPVHWGGDCESTFESMAESLRGGLSLTLSGFGFWSHDIGGFEGMPRADIYKRWLAFGLMSSHSRLHGSWSHRVPWLFDEESVDVCRAFTNLKCRLMPYIYASAVETAAVGVPTMRAMMLEFPENKTAAYLDRQYMLGPNLLVAPVFSTEGNVDFYLPPGKWTSLLGNQVIEGDTWVSEKHGFMSLPLYARPNSIIATGTNVERPEYDYAEGVILNAFQLDDGSNLSVSIPGLDGTEEARFTVTKCGGKVVAERTRGKKAWKICLRAIDSVVSVNGGNQEKTFEGILISASAGRVEISL